MPGVLNLTPGMLFYSQGFALSVKFIEGKETTFCCFSLTRGGIRYDWAWRQMMDENVTVTR
jgi:hypothetical protein